MPKSQEQKQKAQLSYQEQVDVRMAEFFRNSGTSRANQAKILGFMNCEPSELHLYLKDMPIAPNANNGSTRANQTTTTSSFSGTRGPSHPGGRPSRS